MGRGGGAPPTPPPGRNFPLPEELVLAELRIDTPDCISF